MHKPATRARGTPHAHHGRSRRCSFRRPPRRRRCAGPQIAPARGDLPRDPARKRPGPRVRGTAVVTRPARAGPKGRVPPAHRIGPSRPRTATTRPARAGPQGRVPPAQRIGPSRPGPSATSSQDGPDPPAPWIGPSRPGPSATSSQDGPDPPAPWIGPRRPGPSATSSQDGPGPARAMDRPQPTRSADDLVTGRAGSARAQDRPQPTPSVDDSPWTVLTRSAHTAGVPARGTALIPFRGSRGVAQLGSALRSGRRGPRFKSGHPDEQGLEGRRAFRRPTKPRLTDRECVLLRPGSPR